MSLSRQVIWLRQSEPSTVPGHIGRLLLAARQARISSMSAVAVPDGHMTLSRELRKLLEGMVTKTPAVALRRKGAVFVDPVLVAEVEYRAWTDDWKLRHASFKGIRPREDEATVFELP
ncbi:ATP dependent DNA ligase [Sinorhizobium meliloti]